MIPPVTFQIIQGLIWRRDAGFANEVDMSQLTNYLLVYAKDLADIYEKEKSNATRT